MSHGFPTPEDPGLGPDARRILLSVAEVATPAGRVLGPPDAGTVEATARLLGGISPGVLRGYGALLSALDAAALPVAGGRLSRLPAERRGRALERLAARGETAWLVRAVCGPLKMARVDDPALERSLGMEVPRPVPAVEERHRWQQRMTDARTLPEDVEIEADCVVVGTGAGGAPVAARLAERGHGVVLLEEGSHFTRKDFAGRPLALHRKLYRQSGLTLAMGNTLILVPVGRSVGGTTTVNSGTCYRTPNGVLRRWRLENGLHDLGPGSLDSCFERVEDVLGVAPSPPEILGGVARVIARGAEALGYAHGPLARNAPGCDAQGVCCFGCPTDAKRSTNVSYVPLALERGAVLYHDARVERILREGGRAVGVEAFAVAPDGGRRRLVVRAKTVVLACGALHTPALLLRNGLANSSGQVGRGLTIHPTSYAWARFDEPIRGWAEVPQGYAVEEFVDQGLRFEGGFVPLEIAAGTFSSLGRRWTDEVEGFDRLASFGFMVRESSRGRVTLGTGAEPRVSYRVGDADVLTMLRGQEVLARIFLAAGARSVHPAVAGFDTLNDTADVERMAREGPGTVRARHFDISAYHPLGTCQMGADPGRFVVSPEHETHDVEGLFVCDGSAVPGPLGVNPQVTIMAMSERAAAFVERRIEGPRRAPRAPHRRIAFRETMAGTCEDARTGESLATSFTVDVALEAGLGQVIGERGGTCGLEGTVTVAGIAASRPCRGSLALRPLKTRSNLLYDLSFEADDGSRWTLRGEKHAPGFTPTGMTTLHTELRREGEVMARGRLHFDLRDVPKWLASFRLG